MADHRGWNLVGVISYNYAVSMLVDNSKVTECSAFLLDVVNATGISTTINFFEWMTDGARMSSNQRHLELCWSWLEYSEEIHPRDQQVAQRPING
ncbi:hypothetical protein V6N13_001853 [Hibiscus sabdariffa]